MSNQQIVILGRNYTSLLGMIRSVGNMNYDITVIRIVKKIPNENNIKGLIKKLLFGKGIEASSKFVKEYLYIVEQNREELIELLLNKFSDYEEKVIILPTDDYSASTIDLFQDKLRDSFLYPNISNKRGKIVELMDKNLQKELAAKSGLKCSIGKTVNFNNGKYDFPTEITYPVFTKPQISFKGDKMLMKKCNNEKELKEVLDLASKYCDCPILVEKFITIEREYGILGCSYNGEILMPGIVEKLESGRGAHKGVTLLGEVSSLDNYKDLCEKLKKFILSINFNGLFDIDLYESNGTIYFNELNLRFGAFGYAITRSGSNLPEFFVKKLLNILCELPNKINSKTVFISEKVNLEDYNAGYISWKEYKKTYKLADNGFIKSKEDRKPYNIFKRNEIYIHIKNIIKELFGKK